MRFRERLLVGVYAGCGYFTKQENINSKEIYYGKRENLKL